MSAAGHPRLRGLGRQPGHRLLPDRAGRRVRADRGHRSEWWQYVNLGTCFSFVLDCEFLPYIICSLYQGPGSD